MNYSFNKLIYTYKRLLTKKNHSQNYNNKLKIIVVFL